MSKAVILAGGRGTRLQPYTTVFPKPLMPIGDVPILDIVVRQLRHHKFTDIVIAVGYLAELLMAYFNDGARYNMHITYSREDSPLGTAGPLGLIDGLDETFLVMNGDVLTDLDYGELVTFHRANGSLATIATFKRQVKIDLGVLHVDGDNAVLNYIEKPMFDYTVSMGIYVFEPQVLEFIPRGAPLDLPQLILQMLNAGEKVVQFAHEGCWLDIGREDDYRTAVATFERNRGLFLPDIKL
jgi:NDP-sugar pyrophosphorylase family protein